ncbi:MAG TPA: glycosyltransferase family 4 protein [Cytophagaceae bacterium]|nr:glycosyltransferase family 4 protein [Cytophagaceae bacterium]
MRIAVTVNTSWNIYNFRMGLIDALRKAGHEVKAIAPYDEYTDLLEKAGIQCYPIKMENKGSNPFKDLSLIIQLYKIYKKLKPDVILQYTIKPNIYGSIAAGILGIPVINNVSGLGTVFLHDSLISGIAIRLYKFAFRFPRKVFFQNEDDRKLFIERKIVKPEITDVLPGSGIDLDKFSQRAYSRNSPFVFLMVARLLYDKGIVEYAEAGKILKAQGKNVRLKVLGSPDTESKLGIPLSLLEEWEQQGYIEYGGFSNNIIEAMKNADVVVLPSYREGTPRTLLEAASMGIPLIATNVPGCREIVVDNKNGYLCAAKDAGGLAVQMEKMLELNDQQLNDMGKNSREIAFAKFDQNIVSGKYLDAITSIGSSAKMK